MKRSEKVQRVARLWSAGEKYNAIRLAGQFALKSEEEPEGMAQHREALRPSLK